MARNDEMTLAVVGVVISAATLGALVWFGLRRPDPSSPAAPPHPLDPNAPMVTPVGLFPGLKPGDGLIVDAAKASLPAPFAGLVSAVVDQILSDPGSVSVHAISVLPPATFAGTITKDAIVRVVPLGSALPPGFVPVI